MRRKLPYAEGTWVAVPLLDGGYAVGVVARLDGRGQVLGYFFGPVRDEPPDWADLTGLKPADAAIVLMFGDLGLLNSEWPVIGQDPNWNRAHWPFPAFCRRSALSGAIWRVEYDEANFEVAREVPIGPQDAAALWKDVLHGAESARYAVGAAVARRA